MPVSIGRNEFIRKCQQMTCSINGLIHKIKSTKHAMQLFKVEKYIKGKLQKEIKKFTIVLKY